MDAELRDTFSLSAIFPMENITASRDLSPWNYQSLANRSSEVTNPETSLDQALCDMGKSVTMTT